MSGLCGHPTPKSVLQHSCSMTRPTKRAFYQKIDGIKNQLTTMANLVKDPLNEDDEEGLGEEELEVLRKAGILKSSEQTSRKRKPQHIVFAESAEEGMPLFTLSEFPS